MLLTYNYFSLHLQTVKLRNSKDFPLIFDSPKDIIELLGYTRCCTHPFFSFSLLPNIVLFTCYTTTSIDWFHRIVQLLLFLFRCSDRLILTSCSASLLHCHRLIAFVYIAVTQVIGYSPGILRLRFILFWHSNWLWLPSRSIALLHCATTQSIVWSPCSL